MQFKLEINLDNAAFDDDAAQEVARILLILSKRIEDEGFMARPVYDINGNRVGHSEVAS